MNKSHIQHTVGLIQYKIIEIFQADKSLVDQIKQTSGGCDQYIYATFERIGLRLLSYTTEYNAFYLLPLHSIIYLTSRDGSTLLLDDI